MILAIDPSLTGCAMIIGDQHDYRLRTFSSTNQGDHVAERMLRYEGMLDDFVKWIDVPIEAIFIEQYSFGSNDARSKYSAEFGGLLRWHLVDMTERIYEVAPSTLKKFATGTGKGKKGMIAAHLTKRYGVLLDSSDEYDAYALFRLGLIATEIEEAQTVAQEEAVATVINRPKRKPRKSKKKPATKGAS